MKRRNYAVRWLVPLIWMGVISLFSSRPADDLDSVLPLFTALIPGMTGFDWGHYAAYFILALAFEYAFGTASLKPRMKAAVVLICLLFGVLDEYHQSFVDGRMSDPADVLRDGIGAAAAVCLTALPPAARIWRKVLH